MPPQRLPLRRIAVLFGAGIAALRILDDELGLSSRRKFSGKTVLITGGSRGLGLLLARKLAPLRARLIILARNEAELARASDELESMGAEVFAVRCDISRKSDIEEALRQARARFGAIDVLINNAGIMEVADVRSFSLKDLKDVMAVNFWGGANLTWELLPEMIQRRSGMIINITSIGGVIAVPHILPYTASKHAAVGLSQGLAMELRQYGIQVTTIVPGLMRTGSFVNALFKGKAESEFRWFSMGSSLPGISMSANRAAKQILAAAARGQHFAAIGIPAKIARLIYSNAPGLSVRLGSLVNRFLPVTGAPGFPATRAGKESRAKTGKSLLSQLGKAVANQDSEVA